MTRNGKNTLCSWKLETGTYLYQYSHYKPGLWNVKKYTGKNTTNKTNGNIQPGKHKQRLITFTCN